LSQHPRVLAPVTLVSVQDAAPDEATDGAEGVAVLDEEDEEAKEGEEAKDL
jgi:hypothetical protein